MNSKKLGFVLFVLMVTSGACTSVHKVGEPQSTAVSNEAKKIAAQENATYVTEVSFNKDSARLDEFSREKLNDIVMKAKSSGKIDDIKVISWSDKEYPSKNGKLSKHQDQLAERRAEGIKKHLKDADSSLSVDTFNMAERPNALSKLFKTENSKIKRSLETAGITSSENGEEVSPKAGKSMVMVILRN